jgi:hypothetical protein
VVGAGDAYWLCRVSAGIVQQQTDRRSCSITSRWKEASPLQSEHGSSSAGTQMSVGNARIETATRIGGVGCRYSDARICALSALCQAVHELSCCFTQVWNDLHCICTCLSLSHARVQHERGGSAREDVRCSWTGRVGAQCQAWHRYRRSSDTHSHADQQHRSNMGACINDSAHKRELSRMTLHGEDREKGVALWLETKKCTKILLMNCSTA